MAVASNIRAQRNREQGKDANPAQVTAAILKNVAEFKELSFAQLVERTSFPDEAIRKAIQELQSKNWLKGDDTLYFVTSEGVRASYIVSS